MDEDMEEAPSAMAVDGDGSRNSTSPRSERQWARGTTEESCSSRASLSSCLANGDCQPVLVVVRDTGR
jgi:hypothetical protein